MTEKFEDTKRVIRLLPIKKTLHTIGSYSWFIFMENVCTSIKIDMKEVEDVDFKN